MPGPLGRVLQHLPRALPGQPAAARVEEQRGRAAAATRSAGRPRTRYASSAAIAGGRRARDAAYRPCRAAAPTGPGSMSSTSRPTASEIRAPVEYSNSSSARSRSARGPSADCRRRPPSSSATTSSTGSAFGSRRPGRRRLDRMRATSARDDALGGGNWCSPRTAIDGPRRRTAASGGAPHRVTPAQRHQEVADVGLGDVGEVVDAARRAGTSGSGADRAGRTAACSARPRARPRDGRGSPGRPHASSTVTARRPCVRRNATGRPRPGRVGGPRSSLDRGPRGGEREDAGHRRGVDDLAGAAPCAPPRRPDPVDPRGRPPRRSGVGRSTSVSPLARKTRTASSVNPGESATSTSTDQRSAARPISSTSSRLRGLERVLPRHVQQAGRQLPAAAATGVAVLVDQHQPVLGVERGDRHRAVVLDHLTLGDARRPASTTSSTAQRQDLALYTVSEDDHIERVSPGGGSRHDGRAHPSTGSSAARVAARGGSRPAAVRPPCIPALPRRTRRTAGAGASGGS